MVRSWSLFCLLAGAKPGSAIGDQNSGDWGRRGVLTDNVDVEAGMNINVRNEEKLLMFSPEVYWAVPDTLANASNHLINANIVEVIRRDDLKADNFVVYSHIGLTLIMVGLRVARPR